MARQLTDVDVAEEVRKIRSLPWPMRDILPVKNVNRNYQMDENGLGRISRRALEGGPVVVFIGYVFLPFTVDGETETFVNLEEMVKAGWIGD